MQQLTTPAESAFAARPAGSVPFQRSALIGRDEEVSDLMRRLTRMNLPLVTLTGPGGVGKTRLAIAVAEACRESFPGGVWFVSFASLGGEAPVIPEIAATLGIREADPAETLRRLEEQVRGERTLVVLDNLEHLGTAHAEISQLLQAAPQLSVLATSREALGIYGETEYAIRPLKTEQADGDVSPAEALFVARAREAKYGFQPSRSDQEMVRRICQRLDGLPLAIELAATWVKVLSLPQLQANLDRQLDLLAGGARDVPERQRTMRSAIAWSYQLLGDAEQRLFRALSLIPGPFTLEDAMAMAPLEGDEPEGAEDRLAALVSKNLVALSPEGGDLPEPFFQLLQTIRDFGQEELATSGEMAEARARYRDWFTHLGIRLASGIRGPQRRRRLALLNQEHANLRAALTYAIEEDDAGHALELVIAMRRFWDWQGFLAEGRTWCERALALPGADDPALRIQALYALASLAFAQGDYAPSRQRSLEILSLAEKHNDPYGRSFGLTGIGNIAYEQGDLAAAKEAYEEALALRRSCDDIVELEIAIVNVAWVRLVEQDLDGAETLLQESLALTRTAGNVFESGWPLSGLALIAHRRGELERAVQLYEEVVALRRGEDIGLLAGTLVNLAAVERDRGNLARAWELQVEAIGHRIARGERSAVTDAVAAVALLAERAGKTEMAATLFGAAHALRTQIGFGLRDAETRLQEQALSRVRASLDQQAFERAWGEGERMKPEETLALIRGVDPASFAVAPPPVAPVVAQERIGPLTARETEVLRLLATGATDKEIAEHLYISRATASRHVLNIFQKIGVNSRGAAATWAARNDLQHP